MLNVAVIFGGKACEHDISIITGVQVVNNLDTNKYNVVPIYIDKVGNWYLLPSNISIEDVLAYDSLGRRCSILPNDKFLYCYKFGRMKRQMQIDVVVVSMHGLNGEDGSVAALMQLNCITTINCPMLCSAICLDKVAFKKYLAGVNGVSSLPSFSVIEGDDVSEIDKKIVKSFGYPVILKPSNLGSSIGIAVCNSYIELQSKLPQVYAFDKSVLVEKKLNNFKEYNIAVVKFRDQYVLSGIEEPIASNQILTYSDKYLTNNKAVGMANLTRKFPAKVKAAVKKKIERWALLLYQNLHMRGVVRLDYLYDVDTNQLYINEANTIPGSFANYLFQDLSFSQLLNGCIDNAIFENQSDNTVKYFESSVLSNVGNYNKFIK